MFLKSVDAITLVLSEDELLTDTDEVIVVIAYQKRAKKMNLLES